VEIFKLKKIRDVLPAKKDSITSSNIVFNGKGQ
jgi:hypothetical protein